MKKNLTRVNNILCAVLLIVTTISMLIPCWEFTAEQKLKVKTCIMCGKEFTVRNRGKCCSVECQDELYKKRRKEQRERNKARR